MSAEQDLKHPRHAAGTAAGGQFARTRRTEGAPLDGGTPKLHIVGVTDEQTECDRCGKLELKRTVIVHDEDGSEVGRYGTSCASAVLGVKWTGSDVDKLEATRRYRIVTELKTAARHLTNSDPEMAAECLADAKTAGMHRPDELKRWDELFAQVPPEIYQHRPHLIARLGIEPAMQDHPDYPASATGSI